MKKNIISVLKKHNIKCSEILVNDLLSLFYGSEETKKEYQILDDFLRSKYTDEQLTDNATRVSNKNIPNN